MLKIDQVIIDNNENICKNISKFDSSERGLLSQNILSQLRNFVEIIVLKICSKEADPDPHNYDLIKASLVTLKSSNKNLRFLFQFHKLLQISASHYTVDENCSERLMLKYYEYLLKIKIFLKENYNLQVLQNIEKFPLNTDKELAEYHEKIVEKICSPTYRATKNKFKDRYYIIKIKPFFVQQNIYYEVTFTSASDNISKFDRVIAFSKFEIFPNYAVKLAFRDESINVFGKNISIQVIDAWAVSIRPCEINNFSKIFGTNCKVSTGFKDYANLMSILTLNQMPLNELIECSEEYYSNIKNKITDSAKSSIIVDILDKCREWILSDKPGANVLKYLLFHMNNKVIKKQTSREQCKYFSGLHLEKGCIPFDEMPFCSSLKNHNPSMYDVLDCISANNREHEFLARCIQNNTNIEGKLFTPIKELENFNDISELIRTYNKRLYYKHESRKLMLFCDYVYIKEYAEDCAYIIKKLKELSQKGISQYQNSVDLWLKNNVDLIDCPEKKEALKCMFSNSRVALIYGSAGTGKTTLIKHISNYFHSKNKIYLANTHPAVDNLRRKITVANSDFYTIKSFICKKNITKCDVLFIDESSTVCNSDMRKVIENSEFELLVLVGDVYQIESISFGNWFDIARKFIPKQSIWELKQPYRTKNQRLLKLWEEVRSLHNDVLERLVMSDYSERLNESIFTRSSDDEIILCLNYDGLYGINNINSILQNSNSNPAVQCGTGLYKKGDPVLFNESERFSPLIHNNSKGRIVNIIEHNEKVYFDIELDFSINELDNNLFDFELLGESKKGNSIIRFSVDKFRNTDEDDDYYSSVPFQIAYAVSIHKSQGLEYNSVKVVITDEVDERITHNIFYTAITRAKEKLKIYWSPETEKSVLKKMTPKNSNLDVSLLKQFFQS